MKKALLLTLFLLSALVQAQEDKNKEKDKGSIFKDAGDAAKMLLAKQKLYGGQYMGALSIYRDVEKNEPDNATVKYYIGLCHYSLGEIEDAAKVFEKALLLKDIKPETYFFLGKIYHRNGNIDEAMKNYSQFKSTNNSEKQFQTEATLYLTQCENAKSMMAKPLDVMVMNLGPTLNSVYDDKNPCISADGKKLVFTTRRPMATGEAVDSEGDGKFFENIFSTEQDSISNTWGAPHSLDSHVNTPAHDACTSLSGDGKQIFIYKNDINDKASWGGNVFVSKLMNGKWKKPESLGKPVNTTFWEGGACVSPDGKKYYFTSERPGGFGGSDIWMVVRQSRKNWSEPVNLGPTVNSEYDEAGMFLAPDGKTLFFCSNGPKSMGGYDILRTTFENGHWTEPANLGYPINSPAKEGQLSLSANAQFAYLSSDRPGGMGESDLYKIDLKDFAILEKDGVKRSNSGISILRGTIREGFEGYGMPDVDVNVRTKMGDLVAATTTNENGEYFVTLPGGEYLLEVKKKGYKEVSENITLTASNKETLVLEKGYLMKK